MNIKCDDCTSSGGLRYCMKCQKPQCYSCQSVHSQKNPEIVDRFPVGSTYSLGKESYTGKLSWRWYDIETRPPQELDVLFQQTKQLKAAKYFYEEIQTAQTKVMSTFGNEQFVSLFGQYEKAIELYTNTPAKCEEDPELEILYEKTPDRESMYPHFIIQIRKRDKFATGLTTRIGRTENIQVQQQGEEQLKTEFTGLKSNEARKKQELATGLTERAVQKLREELSQLKSELNSKTAEAHFCQLEKDNASLKIALRATKQEKDNIHLSYGQFEKENDSLKTAVQRNLQEKNDLILRLSQVAGAKLMAGNTSIADLGDKYRPTRIAELYSELYDNEWTEAVDDLGVKWSEDIIVRHLFIILQVTQFLKQHTSEIKQLMDARKAIAINVANVLSKDFDRNPTFREYLRNYEWSDEEIVYQITKQKFLKSVLHCRG
ncbi:unnamed protein product [Mytilus edulis]|uniref:B box-type domain-containing protein n=1 Tax=Mytilus edulis TaxID=6550 RepID=A0A8S3Q0L5_MYTED|nr:unnamed protein product [Mytilus edulis]